MLARYTLRRFLSFAAACVLAVAAVLAVDAVGSTQRASAAALTADIFSETVTLSSGKTIASVTLPPGGALTAGTPALHIFAIATTRT
jgi:hypothetical protein